MEKELLFHAYKYINKGILTLYLKKKIRIMNNERFPILFRLEIVVVGAYLWEIV